MYGFNKYTIQSNSLSACIKYHIGDIWFATVHDGVSKYDKRKEVYKKNKIDTLNELTYAGKCKYRSLT